MENKKMELHIKKQLRFIYNQIDTLNAYDPYRTTEKDIERIHKAETRCYMLADFCEALDAENIISHDFYVKYYKYCSECLNTLTGIKNSLIA